jgi:hypothetical protein
VLNASVNYHDATTTNSSTFPTVGGSSTTKGWNVPVTWMLTKGRINNIFTFTYNRNSSSSANLAYNTTSSAKRASMGCPPIDWGIPSLSFTTTPTCAIAV